MRSPSRNQICNYCGLIVIDVMRVAHQNYTASGELWFSGDPLHLL